MKLSNTAILVECRIVACDRPELLRRAIKSLKKQTYCHWKAVVFDDSRNKTGERIVKSFKDKKLVYRWNKVKLGSTANLNQGFSSKPLLGGNYAFVLEDDNAVEKNFIQIGLKHAKRKNFSIVSINQRTVALRKNGSFKKIGVIRKDSRNMNWGRHNLLLNAFCGESLPNGGYFWKIGAENLQVDRLIKEPQLQECIRQTKIKSSIVLAKEVGSIWTLLPEAMIRRTPMENRRFGLTLFLFSKCLLIKYGFDEVKRWIDGCKDQLKKRKAEDNLARVAHVQPEAWSRILGAPKTFFEGIIKSIISKELVPQDTQKALEQYAAKTDT